MMKKCLFTIAAAAALIAFGGCATDNNTPTPKNAGAPRVNRANMLIPANKVNAIAKGMKGETVQQLLGKPFNVQPFSGGNVKGEIWTYRISVTETANQVPTSMRDVPAWDPIANQQITVQEPVYQIEHVRMYTTLQLLIVDGRLVERKPGVDIDRAFY